MPRGPMTVGELEKFLAEFDDSTEVWVWLGDGPNYLEILGVDGDVPGRCSIIAIKEG